MPRTGRVVPHCGSTSRDSEKRRAFVPLVASRAKANVPRACVSVQTLMQGT